MVAIIVNLGPILYSFRLINNFGNQRIPSEFSDGGILEKSVMRRFLKRKDVVIWKQEENFWKL